MSASNWEICPRCVVRARKREAEQLAKVMASYGKVPVDEFDAARAKIKPVVPGDFQTFREDYEIYGATDGSVHVDYSGGCSECCLSLNFNVERRLEGVDE